MQTTCHTLLSVKIYLYFFKDGLLDHIYLKVCGSPYLEIFGFTVKCCHSLWFTYSLPLVKAPFAVFRGRSKTSNWNQSSFTLTNTCMHTDNIHCCYTTFRYLTLCTLVTQVTLPVLSCGFMIVVFRLFVR